VDGCRIGTTKDVPASLATNAGIAERGWGYGPKPPGGDGQNPNVGRWPANVLLDEEAAALLDATVGESASRIGKPRAGAAGNGWGMTATGAEYADRGGPSRFFYTAKASRSEREAGLDDLPPALRTDGRPGDADNPRLRINERRNDHPTVKPVAVMRWLVRLITPPGGVVLDPFLGSGTTGMAALDERMAFIGIDIGERYCEMARYRIEHRHILTEDLRPPAEDIPQGRLF